MEEENTGIVIAKCANHNCGWEVREKEEVTADSIGNISCPMCSKVMAWEIN